MFIPPVHAQPAFPAVNRMELQHYLTNNGKPNPELINKLVPISTLNETGKIDFEMIKSYGVSFIKQVIEKDYFYNSKDENENVILIFGVLSDFVFLSSELLKFKPEKISVELTGQKSMFLFTETKSNRIYLEKFYDNLEEDEIEGVVNIYKDKNLILSDGGNNSFLISQIKSTLSQEMVFTFAG